MRPRPPNRYELLTCGWSGHVLVGLDAADVTDVDPILVRELDGLRWHHCLRCDSGLTRPRPTSPPVSPVPARAEIQLPLRGPLLRDRYVLRLIALSTAPST